MLFLNINSYICIKSVRAYFYKKNRKHTDKQTTNDVTVKQYTKQYKELPRGCAKRVGPLSVTFYLGVFFKCR